MKFYLLTLTTTIACILPISGKADNRIVNGDFETGPFNSSGEITNWTVGGNGSVELLDEGATTPSHAAAMNGGGDSEGNTLSQTFATTIGATYSLDFDAGVLVPQAAQPCKSTSR